MSTTAPLPPGGEEAAALTAGSHPHDGLESAGWTPATAAAVAFTHDARNLLTALGLYADLLNAPGVLPQRYRHYASELRLLADRSSSLLGRVLLPAERALPEALCEPVPAETSASARETWVQRAERSSAPGEPLCDAGAVLRQFLPLLRAQTEGTAAVVLRVGAGTPPLPVSSEALERITANLVCNAAQAMRSASEARPGVASAQPAGTVWITLQARDGMARLSIEDSGPGMPPAVAAVFVRPDPHRPLLCGEGRGWGHRIVHALVSETGGRLAVRPRPAGGTVVTVRWPLRPLSSVSAYAAELPHATGTVGASC